MRPHRLRTVAVAAALLVGLTACGGESGSEKDESGKAGSEAFPVTIEHALGKTTIPAPEPDFRFEANDVAVAVGTSDGLADFRSILGG